MKNQEQPEHHELQDNGPTLKPLAMTAINAEQFTEIAEEPVAISKIVDEPKPAVMKTEAPLQTTDSQRVESGTLVIRLRIEYIFYVILAILFIYMIYLLHSMQSRIHILESYLASARIH